MTNVRAYLDHNATTPLRAEARAAMLAALEVHGAASSIHADGRKIRRLIEGARADIAASTGAEAKNVVLCGSATEANNMALSLAWQTPAAARLDRLAVSAVEHASVRNGMRVPADAVTILPVDSNGVVDLVALDAVLDEWRLSGLRGLVSVMLANNETGVLQPVAEIARRVHASGGLVHCDAAQAPGRIEVALNTLGADFLTLSSHKLGGPHGAGALVLASDAFHLREPLLRGGGQERGLRAGTENAPAIAGFGAAVRAAVAGLPAYREKVLSLRTCLEKELRSLNPDVVFFGDQVERLPNTLCFAEAGITAETALINLDLGGVSVSAGSACSSGKVKTSHVLLAMGVPPELASCAIRVSLGHDTTVDNIELMLAVWTRLRKSLHERKPHRAA